MTKQNRKKYDSSFKREAVPMAAQSDKPDRQIEEDLGIFQGAIRRWREELKKDPANAFPGTGHQTSVEEENRRLKKELNDAVMERDILKKAIAIFSRTRKINSSL
ncbi:MAG TPA: transposase [Chitinispirillaceae bacterium]|nr:transposase [Chitinispirillaceae bacterium]